METKSKEKRPTLNEDLLTELAANRIASPASVIEEFELLTINDDATYLAREIAKKVKERIVSFTHLIEELLQPDSGVAAMNECSFFSEEEQTRLVAKYRELMHLIRGFTAADVEGREEEYRAFLKKTLPAWEQQRGFLREVAARLHDGWNHEQAFQEEKGYFG